MQIYSKFCYKKYLDEFRLKMCNNFFKLIKNLFKKENVQEVIIYLNIFS